MNSVVDDNDGIVWYPMDTYWRLQKNYSIHRLLFTLFFSIGALLIFSAVFHLNPSETFAMMLLGASCGFLGYALNEVTWRNDAPKRIGLSEEGMWYEVRSQREYIPFSDITRLTQRLEAAFSLKIELSGKRLVFLSVGMGEGSAVGKAIREGYARWCLKRYGRPPKLVSPSIYGRWLVSITPDQ